MDSTDVVAALLSWAVTLSHYPAPTTPPELRYVERGFLVEHACGGRKCSALGWYDNDGHIYIDERLRDQDTPFVRSIIVHEMVHYLQDLSGKFDPAACEDYNRREREAYAVQREFVARAAGHAAFLRIELGECGVEPKG